MSTKPRPRPSRLAAKLLQIRQCLGVSQSQLVQLLNVGLEDCRISEYERDIREPSLITLLAYSYLVGIPINDLVDDRIDLSAEIRIKRRRKTVDVCRTENI